MRLVENHDFSYPLHSTPPLGGPRRTTAIPFGMEYIRNLEWRDGEKKFEDMFSRLDRIGV